MPLFVKGIYTLAEKVKQLQKVSKLGHKLNLVTRQAEVVSVDASLSYLTQLGEAIVARQGSLQKTQDDLQMAVNNGRVPEAELLKLETSINISIPLFDRSLGTSIDLAQNQLHREKLRLAQLQIDLEAEADTLRQQLPVLEQSQLLAGKSLANSKKILEIARVAYRNGRITTEEYIRNEVDVLDNEAALHKTIRDRWQVLCRQAVLFGDDLTGVVQ